MSPSRAEEGLTLAVIEAISRRIVRTRGCSKEEADAIVASQARSRDPNFLPDLFEGDPDGLKELEGTMDLLLRCIEAREAWDLDLPADDEALFGAAILRARAEDLPS